MDNVEKAYSKEKGGNGDFYHIRRVNESRLWSSFYLGLTGTLEFDSSIGTIYCDTNGFSSYLAAYGITDIFPRDEDVLEALRTYWGMNASHRLIEDYASPYLAEALEDLAVCEQHLRELMRSNARFVKKHAKSMEYETSEIRFKIYMDKYDLRKTLTSVEIESIIPGKNASRKQFHETELVPAA